MNEPKQSMALIQQTGISQEQLSVISRFAVASVGSQGTVGGLVVAGFVCRFSSFRSHICSSHSFHFIHIIFFVLALENSWMESFSWYWCTLWMCLLL